MKPPLVSLLAVLGFAATSSVHAATGVMTKDEDLRATAGAASAVVGRAAKGARVEILARQGGWTQVSSGGKSGWVRILAVKTDAPSGGGDALGVLEATTSKRDPGKVVAVAGLRGLNEEELKLARFDAGELQLLDRYASNRAEAEQFARAAGLQAASVPYLPNPKREQRENNASPWGDGGF